MTRKNIFISHVHKDDKLLPKLKSLLKNAGMDVRDGSINSTKENNATSEDYIKREILAPRIRWASTLVVLINRHTANSEWVNWEIRYALSLGKQIVGVFAQGATDADIPDELAKHADAVVVGWQGSRLVDAIEGEVKTWDDPEKGAPRTTPVWSISRYSCA